MRKMRDPALRQAIRDDYDRRLEQREAIPDDYDALRALPAERRCAGLPARISPWARPGCGRGRPRTACNGKMECPELKGEPHALRERLDAGKSPIEYYGHLGGFTR